jgi:hypothetical protein
MRRIAKLTVKREPRRRDKGRSVGSIPLGRNSLK